MTETERLMQEIRDAANAMRDAETEFHEVCADARLMGLSESDIATARAQALR